MGNHPEFIYSFSIINNNHFNKTTITYSRTPVSHFLRSKMFLLNIVYLLCVLKSVTVGQILNIHFSDDDKILEEGDACKIDNIFQGKCVSASKCSDRRNIHPKVCSFVGNEPVVCCKSSERISEISMFYYLIYKFIINLF